MIFSLAAGLSAGDINPEAITYGYERLRFLKPVFIGDTITARVSVEGKRDHKTPTHGIVSELLQALNQRRELVFSCEHLLLVRKMI